jgi:UDP-N-acetylmuramoylalanine--D-glutamate ligase
MVATMDGTAPLDLDQLTLGAFTDRPVAVLGLARSGLALARFLHDHGASVTVYDRRSLAQLDQAVSALEGRAIRLLVGPEVDPADALRDQALIATSPSISSRYPTTEPRLRAALGALEAEGRTPVVSEIDLFLRLCPATTIGVTGTKGKTTTSALAAAVLDAGEAPVLLGGNIGTPLVERLPELTPGHRVVLELSELQLPTLSRGTTVAVYTHVTADHLDRHGSLDAYRTVKRRLAELVPADGALVLNDEDPVSAGYAADAAQVVRYRRGSPPPGGLGVSQGWIVASDVPRLMQADAGSGQSRGPGQGDGSQGQRILPLDAIPIPGEHNVSNVLAAVAVGLVLGVRVEGIEAAVRSFAGVPHRLETIAVVDGVRYVNDSQGTQPDAVIAALRSFPGQPLVLIAGGQDKGAEYAQLAGEAVERAAAVLLIGENAPRIEAALASAGHGAVERLPSLEAAVTRGAQMAQELLSSAAGREPIVLLSPAAASFDMFHDYAARGEAFRAAVEALPGRRSEGWR